MTKSRNRWAWVFGLVLLPAAVLTACNQDPDKATGLDTGLNEYNTPCEETGLDIPINFVVLTTDTGVDPGDVVGGVPRAGSQISSVEYPTVYSDSDVFEIGEIQVLTDHFRQVDVTDPSRPMCSEDVFSDGVDDKIRADDGCIRFSYLDHHFRADLDANGVDSSCNDLLALGDAAAGQTPEALDQIQDAVNACEDQQVVRDGAFNFYVWDNPDNNNSHGSSNGCVRNSGSDCHPYVALDKHRLLHTTSAPEEHEVGHAFGLGHICDPNVQQTSDPANIMQRGHDLDEDGLDPCDFVASNGTRGEKFGVVVWDRHGDPMSPLDQVDVIAESATTYRTEWCDTVEGDAARYAVVGDPACTSGTGTFAMMLRKAGDNDNDGMGWGDLVPVLVSGQPMSSKAWITSAKLVNPGSSPWIAAAHDDEVLQWGPLDEQTNPNVTTLSVVGMAVPIKVGTVSAAAPWLVEGIKLSVGYANPKVELTWACGQVPDTSLTHLTRPEGYVLPLSAFGSIWADAVIVRPNFAQDLVWFEVQGRPHDAQRVRLTPHGGRSAFTLRLLGIDLSGELWMIGNKLKFELVSGKVDGFPLVPFTRTLAPY